MSEENCGHCADYWANQGWACCDCGETADIVEETK